MASNTPNYPGKIVTMFYTTTGGKQQRSMPLDETGLAKVLNTLQTAGPGAKLVIKETTPAYRSRKLEEMQQEGKRGGPATFILEVLTAEELATESKRLSAKNNDSF
jgi:hypothetical protein